LVLCRDTDIESCYFTTHKYHLGFIKYVILSIKITATQTFRLCNCSEDDTIFFAKRRISSEVLINVPVLSARGHFIIELIDCKVYLQLKIQDVQKDFLEKKIFQKQFSH